MTTWTQDYPALPGSAHAAAKLAHTVAFQHLPGRALDAHKVVDALFAVGLARSSPTSNLNLITEADDGRKVRFELHYPNDQAEADGATTASFQSVSALSDSSGDNRTERGRMIYAELWRGTEA